MMYYGAIVFVLAEHLMAITECYNKQILKNSLKDLALFI